MGKNTTSKIAGAANQAAGKIKEELGNATGSKNWRRRDFARRPRARSYFVTTGQRQLRKA
jgi:hypothetical protein